MAAITTHRAGALWLSPFLPRNPARVRVNLGHPFIKNCLFFALPGSLGYFDLITRQWMMPTGTFPSSTIALTETPVGRSWTLTGSSLFTLANNQLTPRFNGTYRQMRMAAGIANPSGGVGAVNSTILQCSGGSNVISIQVTSANKPRLACGSNLLDQTTVTVNDASGQHVLFAGLGNSSVNNNGIIYADEGTANTTNFGNNPSGQTSFIIGAGSSVSTNRAVTWAAAWLSTPDSNYASNFTIPGVFIPDAAALNLMLTPSRRYGLRAGVPPGVLLRC